MEKTESKSSFTTIAVDKKTAKTIDKLAKRYSLKKGEFVMSVIEYIDKAYINPKEKPESIKAETTRLIKRMDDIIKFIRLHIRTSSKRQNTTNP